MTATGPAAVVVAAAPSSPDVLPGLALLLDPARRAALQALLIRRAAAWAAAAAAGGAAAHGGGAAAYGGAAHRGAAMHGGGAAAYGGAAHRRAAMHGGASVAVAPADAVEEVAALLPAGVTAFAQEGGAPAEILAAAIARAGRGPLLVAVPDCPRLSAAHAAAALADLVAGCDVVFGATLEGGWYLAGLREPRPELLAVPDARRRAGGIGLVLERARELGADVGMLRHERTLATPGDAAALLADPLLDRELRAALSAA